MILKDELQKKFELITFVATEKRFYKKFASKVVFRQNNSIKPYDIGVWIGQTYPNGDLPEIKILHSYRNFLHTLFLNNLDDIPDLLNRFNKSIKEIHLPINQKHIDNMKDDEKIRIKKKLFFDEYRYRVTFKERMRSSKTNELKIWEKELFEDGQTFSRWNQWRPTLFLKNEDDLVMTKLAQHDNIFLIERVVLESELENQK